jgi:hypothetical protein
MELSTPLGISMKRNTLTTPIEDRESFDNLIRVLEDALEAAAKVLGPDARPSARSRYHIIEHPNEIYQNLCDLLDDARAGRSRLP